jgi:hypothetical protein
MHRDQPGLAVAFAVVASAQLLWGTWATTGTTTLGAWAGVAVNLGALAAWLTTRLVGLGWFDGLEVAEPVHLSDAVAAVLGAIAGGSALAGATLGALPLRDVRRLPGGLALSGLTVVGLMAGVGHDHAHEHRHAESATSAPATHDHGRATVATVPTAASGASSASDIEVPSLPWPRPFDPSLPLDLAGVPGVTSEQQQRATDLVLRTQQHLPAFADYDDVLTKGYRSIGDAHTGFEHVINREFIDDDAFLDPTAPESLVFRVEGDQRVLVSAMFIAPTGTPLGDPVLEEFAGPLIAWHVHDDLCWGLGEDGVAKVMGVIDEAGRCPPGSIRAGGDNPMVHVWIVPHECGPFAALEGVGAGRTQAGPSERVDRCRDDHDH